MNSTGVVATTNVVEACTDVDIAIMLGGFPRKDGMERKDVMAKNVSIYKAQASALEQHASSNCKVRFFLVRRIELVVLFRDVRMVLFSTFLQE